MYGIKKKRAAPPNEFMIDQIGFQLIPQIEKIDPTPHKEYTQWLCKVYASGLVKWEDLASRGADSLTRFQKLKIKKQLAPEDKDIGRIKTLQQLEQMLNKYPEVEDQQVNRGQAKEYYKDADLRVIIPEDEAAACYYGQGTKWCTAAKKNNMFNKYNKEGTLYIVIPTKTNHPGEKYQFHFESGQFMDDSDNQIDLKSWVKAYPQLKTIFHEQAKKNLTIPLLNNAKVLYKKFEEEKEKQVQFAHQLLMNNISKTLQTLPKEFHAAGADATEAHKLKGILWDTLQSDSNGLVGNVVLGLTIAALIGGEDDLWDNAYFACESWLSESEFGNSLTEFFAELDGYSISNSVAEILYNKFVPQTVAKIKSELQKYIE